MTTIIESGGRRDSRSASAQSTVFPSFDAGSVVEGIATFHHPTIAMGQHTPSIRFHCPACGQRLKASPSKVGRKFRCPNCNEHVTVPATTPPPPPTAPPPPPDDGGPDFSRFVVSDDRPWIAVSEGEFSPATTGDEDVVAVPRRVVYFQGILLGVVALAAFALGALFASHSTPVPPGPAERGQLSGRVTWMNGDRPRPDSGCLIVLLPTEHHPAPDERINLTELGLEGPEASPNPASLARLQSWGGLWARADDQGHYRCRPARRQEYFLLAISFHSPVKRISVDRSELAQMGRYFLTPAQTIEPFDYHWERLTFSADRVLDIRF